MRMRVAVATTIAMTLMLVGCSAEKSDWQAAQSADTVEAYEQFISKHPQSTLANEARERTKQLAEEKDWENATGIDTADSYQAFLGKYPEGKWSEEARIRIENFNVLGAPPAAANSKPETAAPAAAGAEAAAPAAPSVAAAPAPQPKPAPAAAKPAPAATKPAPAPAAAKPTAPVAAAPASATASGYRVQLGALSSAAKANSEWQRLTGKFAAQLNGLSHSVVAVDTKAGKLYRLQAAVGAESKARAVCASLSAAGQGCVVVPPK